jgi:4-hydroxy-tetrahydrodipicolinate synthase
MMSTSPFARAIAAIATPFRADFSVDFDSLIAHAQWLFENGCDGLVLFGTTGEAVSLTVAERKVTLEKLVAGGIGAGKVVVGTGCCAVDDAVSLTRHAAAQGVAGVLVLPPYFYKGVRDEGLARYYDGLIAGCGDELPPLYLYHIPQVAGVGVSPALLDVLVENYGSKIRGYKDSSGDWTNSARILARFPSLDLYVGSESLLLNALRAGGRGLISAGTNVQPARVRKAIECWSSNEAEASWAASDAVRKALEKTGPLVPAVKAILARIHGHAGWAETRPPLVPLATEEADKLIAELRALGLEGL